MKTINNVSATESETRSGEKEEKQMKVLMLGWEFPPFFTGGVGTVCKELSKALSKKDVEITYVMPTAPKDADISFLDLLAVDAEVDDEKVDIDVKEVDSLLQPYLSREEYKEKYKDIYSSIKKKSGASHDLYGENLMREVKRFAEKVRILAEEEEFDVIHAHDWTTFLAGIAAREASGKPLVTHMHITEFDKTGGEEGDPKIHSIESEGMEEADAVITVSNFVKKRCVNQYGISSEKIRVVHNAVEFSGEKAEEADHIKREDKLVLFLGRITLQKGPDYFLEAAKKVVDVDPNVKFVMAGSGDMLPRMIEKSAELGISRKVIFPGFVSREKGDQLYRTADVFVMPSVSEPFGIVPLESLYQGTPAIVSKQSGVSEVLDNCLKVDFWDVDDTANKILASLHYTKMKEMMSSRGEIEIEEEFSWETPAENCIEIYKDVKKDSEENGGES